MQQKEVIFQIKGSSLEFIERKHKRKRVDQARNFIRRVPCTQFITWLNTMQLFIDLRNAAWLQSSFKPDSFWQLLGEKPPTRAFLGSCINMVESVFPTHFGKDVFTSHSCRRGAASAALSIGVRLERLSWWGGWSFYLAAIFDYLDFSLQTSPAATLFFHWLKSSPVGALPVEGLSEEEVEVMSKEVSDNDTWERLTVG